MLEFWRQNNAAGGATLWGRLDTTQRSLLFISGVALLAGIGLAFDLFGTTENPNLEAHVHPVQAPTADSNRTADARESLSDPRGAPPTLRALLQAEAALEFQHTIERDLGQRAQRLLDLSLGRGRSLVSVTATIQRHPAEEKQERIFPDESAVLRSETSESLGATAAEAQTSAPGAVQPVAREALQFDVSRSQRSSVEPMGAIRRLSVAVLIDSMPAEPSVAPLDSPTDRPASRPSAPDLGFGARALPGAGSPQPIAAYARLVQRAVGFDADRGDRMEIQRVAFAGATEAPAPTLWERPLVQTLAPGLAHGLLTLTGVALLISLVLRPALRELNRPRLGAHVALRAAPAAKGSKDVSPKPPDTALMISKDQTERVAETVREWLRE